MFCEFCNEYHDDDIAVMPEKCAKQTKIKTLHYKICDIMLKEYCAIIQKHVSPEEFELVKEQLDDMKKTDGFPNLFL